MTRPKVRPRSLETLTSNDGFFRGIACHLSGIILELTSSIHVRFRLCDISLIKVGNEKRLQVRQSVFMVLSHGVFRLILSLAGNTNSKQIKRKTEVQFKGVHS